MNSETENKHEEAETRNEGESAIHEHGDPGPGGQNLGPAIRAAADFRPLPMWVSDRLTSEALAGDMDSLFALVMSAGDQASPLPQECWLRVEEAAEAGESLAETALGYSLVAIGQERRQGALVRRGLRLLDSAAAAGNGDALWLLACHAADRARPIAEMHAVRSAAAGNRFAKAAIRYAEGVHGIMRARAVEAKAAARLARARLATPIGPIPEHEAKIRDLEHRVLALRAENSALAARASAAESARDERVAKDEAVTRYAASAAATNWELVKARKLLAEQAEATARTEADFNEFTRKSASEVAALKSHVAHLESQLRRREARRATSN